MNRLPIITIVNLLMFAFAALGQEASGEGQGGLPTAEEQLKVLTEKLDLTAGQQIKIKPIVRHLHDATQRLMGDQTLSNDERLSKVRPHRLLADEKIREILTAEQKKKLDEYELGPHPEMHGTLSGTPKPAVQ
jgi:Spy/CpxP family protein refolding chaperone